MHKLNARRKILGLEIRFAGAARKVISYFADCYSMFEPFPQYWHRIAVISTSTYVAISFVM
jgi:tellurite resistance-related uncharacterized protein